MGRRPATGKFNPALGDGATAWNANGVVTNFTSANQLAGYGYDAAGNQLGDGQHTYTYDAEGKVVMVDSGTAGNYSYDAMDHRVAISTQAYSHEFLFDPFGRRQSTWVLPQNAGTEGRIYWDGNHLLANRAQNGTTYFHHGNHLGTERVRTDYNGNTVNTMTSLPFGGGFNQTSGDSNGPAQDENQYTGQDRDPETNTEHFQYRQYSETNGRWLSPDPYSGSYDTSNPQSLNRYAYVLNNPLGFRDPDGRWCYWEDGSYDDEGYDEGSCAQAGGAWGGPPDATSYSGGYSGVGSTVVSTIGQVNGQNGQNGSTGQNGSNGHGVAPNKTTCKTGFGAGITIGADAGAGVGPLGAGANGSVGAGVFGGNGINAGAFASGGAAARSFGHLASAAGSTIHNFFAGAGGGVGGGLFLTNASQASQLSGQSQTYNVDLGAFANGSGQFSIGTDAAGNEIWSFSFQVGVGGGALFHAVTNKTATAGRRGGC